MKPNGYPSHPETKNAQAEVIKAFTEARHTVLKMSSDPRFHSRLRASGVDPYDGLCTEKYWDTFATFAGGFVSRAHESGVNTVNVDAVELLAITPELLYKRSRLANAKGPKNQHERVVASNFNSLIRMFATRHPDTPVSTMTNSLLGMANQAIEDPTLLQDAGRFVKASIRGAQHELAFGQILGKTNRQFESATLDEDLKGVDYIVEGMTGNPLYVDVKASRVKTRGAEYAFNSGVIVMASLLEDRDFGDRFFVEDYVAVSKNVELDRKLMEAEYELNHGSIAY